MNNDSIYKCKSSITTMKSLLPQINTTYYSVRLKPSWYREPKPKSNIGIGIGAEIFFQNQNFHFQIFLIFSTSFLGIWVFKSLILKMIWKYLKFGSKFGFKGPFVMEKIPHIIGNYILSLKYGFGIYRLRYWPKVSTKIVVLVVHY